MARNSGPKGRLGSLKAIFTSKRARTTATQQEADRVLPFRPVWGKERREEAEASDAEASAPAYVAEHVEGSTVPPASDDKEELRRQRLIAERSAPPQEEEAESSVAASNQTPGMSAPAEARSAPFEPSAPSGPVVNDDDHFEFLAPSSHHPLPRYER